MNKIVFFISLFTLSTLYSCTEDEDLIASAPQTPTKSSSEVYMKAISAGKTWEAKTVTANMIAEGYNSVIYIIGSDGNGSNITISLSQDINQAGTYEYSVSPDSEQTPIATFVNADTDLVYQATFVRLTISEYNRETKTIKGDFEFKGVVAGSKSKVQHEVSGGVFKVNY